MKKIISVLLAALLMAALLPTAAFAVNEKSYTFKYEEVSTLVSPDGCFTLTGNPYQWWNEYGWLDGGIASFLTIRAAEGVQRATDEVGS